MWCTRTLCSHDDVQERFATSLMKSTIYPRTQQIIAFIVSFVLCFATSALGALASMNARSFYGALTQPSWAPPGWLFGPVWTVLFALMALAAWLVWRSAPPSRTKLITLMAFGRVRVR
jgi:translocator protein